MCKISTVCRIRHYILLDALAIWNAAKIWELVCDIYDMRISPSLVTHLLARSACRQRLYFVLYLIVCIWEICWEIVKWSWENMHVHVILHIKLTKILNNRIKVSCWFWTNTFLGFRTTVYQLQFPSPRHFFVHISQIFILLSL